MSPDRGSEISFEDDLYIELDPNRSRSEEDKETDKSELDDAEQNENPNRSKSEVDEETDRSESEEDEPTVGFYGETDERVMAKLKHEMFLQSHREQGSTAWYRHRVIVGKVVLFGHKMIIGNALMTIDPHTCDAWSHCDCVMEEGDH